MRLFILDDTAATLESLRFCALEAGFQAEDIITASSLEDARKVIEQPFDVAVIDLHLGDRGLQEAGVDLIGEIHQDQPSCRIIGFSVRYDNTVGIQAMIRGADDYISGRWPGVNWETLMVNKLHLARELAAHKVSKSSSSAV